MWRPPSDFMNVVVSSSSGVKCLHKIHLIMPVNVIHDSALVKTTAAML